MSGLPVHTGYWVNWSKGNPIVGATITLPAIQGNFLIAFLALVVHAAGTQFWGILCFAFHQVRFAAGEGDAFHGQQQVILRNSTTDTSALFWLMQQAWSWRRKPCWSLMRSLPLILVALLHILIFGAAGVFSSRVSQAGNEVLLLDKFCGTYIPGTNKPTTQFNQTDLDAAAILTIFNQALEEDKLAYTRECYSGASSAGEASCQDLVSPRLQSKVNFSAPCPFQADVCKYAGAMELDTGYINSELDLGINSRPEDRVWYRTVSTWVPMNVTNYKSNWMNGNTGLPGDKSLRYSLGSKPPLDNYTFIFSNYSLVEPHSAYRLQLAGNFPGNSMLTNYYPISDLNLTDADVLLVALYNYAAYTQPVVDPLFESTRNVSGLHYGFGNNSQVYLANEPVSILAIHQQYQFCYSSNFSTSCSPLSSMWQSEPAPYRAETQNYPGFSLQQRFTAGWIWASAASNEYWDTLLGQGPTALVAQGYAFVAQGSGIASASLPDNQWQIEGQHLHNVSLAGLQRTLVTRVAPPIFELRPGQSSLPFLNLINNPRQLLLCSSQKVRNAAYSSFSVLSLSMIVAFGGLIILLDFCIADIVFYVRSRRRKHRTEGVAWVDLKRRDWHSSQALQLHRMAMEGRGIGPWKSEGRLVPVLENNHKTYAFEEMEMEL